MIKFHVTKHGSKRLNKLSAIKINNLKVDSIKSISKRRDMEVESQENII